MSGAANVFENQVAVITGGGSGIGLAVARALAARGARLVLADVDRTALEAARKELVAYSSHGQALSKMLIQSGDSIGAMVKQIKKDKKSIDPKVAGRLFKELDGLHSAAGSVLELIEDGVALADELAGVLQSAEGAADVARYKSNYAAFVKGVATIKTQTKKSGGSAKIIDALSKTLTKKK